MKAPLAAMALVFAGHCFAQQLISPEVQSNGVVTFRLRAPNAKDVQIHGEAANGRMEKDERGVWSFTTEPLEPDIYTYSFNVDGLRTIDLNNPLLKYNLLNSDSEVHVPGPASLAWEVNDVPHGIVHRHFYHSGVAEDNRDFYVYTPPGYNPSARKKYPVLYLLHGYSDDASAWVSVGRANVILDNLIARKQAQPMIVVMPLGYGTMEIVKGGWGRVRSADLWQRNVNGFRDALLTEVMPQVERNYRVSRDRTQRAIAGLSMGGSESLLTGLNTLGKFAWIGAFSSGGMSTNYDSQFPKLDKSANRKLRLLWIACGKDDGLFGGNKQFSEWLDSKGVKHQWVESPGAHSFLVWRRYLAEFAPLLFQKKP